MHIWSSIIVNVLVFPIYCSFIFFVGLIYSKGSAGLLPFQIMFQLWQTSSIFDVASRFLFLQSGHFALLPLLSCFINQYRCFVGTISCTSRSSSLGCHLLLCFQILQLPRELDLLVCILDIAFVCATCLN